jgi:hypothetical protein
MLVNRLARRSLVLSLLLVPAVLAAQVPNSPIFGTWKVDPRAAAKQKSGPAVVIVRPDSSASYGKETVRWRLTGKHQISLVLGGEWVAYDVKVKNDQLTLSGGDLSEPITLRRVGPPTARPDSVKIPADPDKDIGS